MAGGFFKGLVSKFTPKIASFVPGRRAPVPGQISSGQSIRGLQPIPGADYTRKDNYIRK